MNLVLPIIFFALTLWLRLYLLQRHTTEPRLGWTGAGLMAYAVGMADLLVFAQMAASATATLLATNLLSSLPVIEQHLWTRNVSNNTLERAQELRILLLAAINTVFWLGFGLLGWAVLALMHPIPSPV